MLWITNSLITILQRNIKKCRSNRNLNGSQYSHQFLIKVVSISNVTIESFQLAANYNPLCGMCHQTASENAVLHWIQTTKCFYSFVKRKRMLPYLLYYYWIYYMLEHFIGALKKSAPFQVNLMSNFKKYALIIRRRSHSSRQRTMFLICIHFNVNIPSHSHLSTKIGWRTMKTTNRRQHNNNATNREFWMTEHT